LLFAIAFLTLFGYDAAMVVTNEVIYEVLNKIQAGVAVIKTTVADPSRLVVRMREDDFRLEAMQ
jgi:hypothetical protein